MEQLFYIGSYSEKGGYFPNANGEGLIICSLDLNTGKIVKKSSCPEAANATYLAKCGSDTLLVASDKYYEHGNVMSFLIRENGGLTQLSSQSTKGTSTCHLTVNIEGNRVFGVSYLNSTLSVHSMKDGFISPAEYVYRYSGQGPNKERQEESHAHCAVISPNGKWLYVCDLGSDKIWLHDMDRLTGKLLDVTGIEVPSGYGPRHLVFHPTIPLVYVICELNAHLLTYRRNDQTGMLTLVNDIPTLPEDYNDVPSAAAIRLHPFKKALYVSNRIHNSIAVLSINKRTGIPNYKACFMTEGKEPRDFNIDPSGKWLVCANQNSDTVISFELNVETGLPIRNIGSVMNCGTPVCVLF